MLVRARLILAIRKSLGNPGTQLKPLDVLRPSIKDVDEYAAEYGLNV
jgi:hypothetical protein